MFNILCPLEWLYFQNWTLILYGTTLDPLLGNDHLRTVPQKPVTREEIGMQLSFVMNNVQKSLKNQGYHIYGGITSRIRSFSSNRDVFLICKIQYKKY